MRPVEHHSGSEVGARKTGAVGKEDLSVSSWRKSANGGETYACEHSQGAAEHDADVGE